MTNSDWRLAIRGALLSLCLGLFLVACEVTPTQQFTPQLVVEGLIRAGSPVAQVNVNRTYRIEESFDTTFPGVKGVVWRVADTWPLANPMRDVYATPELSPLPGPGDTFGIRIAKDGFDTVYGRTVVPDTFSILFPREGDTVTINDSMVWTRSRHCAGYYMSVRDIEGKDTSYYSLAIPNDTTGNNFDSLVFRFPQMVFLYHAEPGLNELRVCALDTNYFDWISGGGIGFGGAASETTHLSGGLGVFGSCVGESLKVYVKTETTGIGRTGRIRNPDRGMRNARVAGPRTAGGPSTAGRERERLGLNSEVGEDQAFDARRLRLSSVLRRD
ncbi:MAG TPA: DUF4249 family protein [bacterium]|nr:DUF4249 family protein [bacterium]